MSRARVAVVALAIAVGSTTACGGSARGPVEVSVNRDIDGITLGMTRAQVKATSGAGGDAAVVTTSRKVVVEFDASGHVSSLHVRGGTACLVHPHVCIGERGGAREAAEAFGKAARAESDDFQTMVVIRGSYRGRKATTMLWYSAPGTPTASDEEEGGESADKVPASGTIRSIDLYIAR
jgi:hypothetical protein